MTPVAAAPDLEPGAARRLQLQVSRRLDGLLQGDHLGVLPGPGSEPAEARRYLPGDDVRRIDWAVSARTLETHVRDAVAERELETTLVVDLSGSMQFGTRRWEKRELALSVAAAFAHLGSGPGDRVGAVVLSGAGVRRLPPRTGRTSVVALLHALLSTARDDRPGPGLAAALSTLADAPHRRGLVVVVSDLLGADDWAALLRRLGHRHDVVVAQLVDPRELALPDVGLLRLVDPETGRELEVQTSSRALRERYAAAARDRLATQADAVRRARASHVVLATDGDWLLALARHLTLRRRTRSAVAR